MSTPRISAANEVAMPSCGFIPSRPRPLVFQHNSHSHPYATASSLFEYQISPAQPTSAPHVGGISSPEHMVTSETERSPRQHSFELNKGKGKATPAGLLPEPGIFRRHTISTLNNLRAGVSRKRSYDQANGSALGSYRIDRPSSRNTRIKLVKRNSHPSEVYRPGQKTELLDLPAELLATIISYIIESPAPGENSRRSSNAYARLPKRRWTIENTPRTPPTSQPVDFNTVFNLERDSYHDGILQHQDEAFYPSRMLNSLASTCHRLRKLIRLKEWDVRFWRPAARIYYHIIYYPKILPESLDLIQGSMLKNQTSWRNFLTCTVQYIDTRKRGVESFGTKAGCQSALPWRAHQVLLRQTRSSSSPPERKLKMLCRQPGPDIFDISWDATSRSYTIAMGLDGGKSYASVDENGNFTRGEDLPSHLSRSVRGLFPADILEVKKDRFSIVKIAARQSQGSNIEGVSSPSISIQEVIRWDISCVPDVIVDDKARIARCASWDNYLCFTLFKQNFADPTAAFLDPDEASTIYCIKATQIDSPLDSGSNFKSELLWTHDFDQDVQTNGTDETEQLEPAVCHIALSSSYAAILVRWNTSSGIQHIVDENRKLSVVNIKTGKLIRQFNLPQFSWDYRHSDMGDEYNQIRLDKLRSLYDDRYASHRATRVHDDKIVLLETRGNENSRNYPSAKIITGSHDYCNWVWDLDQECDCEPLLVLDDFYWEEDTSKQQEESLKKQNKWNRFKERAGWWCATPNQVLDFWHDFSITPDGRYFAAVRAGRTFIWDIIEERPTIRGYSCEIEDAQHEFIGNTPPGRNKPNLDQSLERYLGKPVEACEETYGHMFTRWFEYKKRIPEQGLWMVFDDWSVVYLDRNDILGACGLPHRDWIFSEEDFESINLNSKPSFSTPPLSVMGINEDEETDSDTDMEEHYESSDYSEEEQ